GVVEARHQQGRPPWGGERRTVRAGGRVIDPQGQRPGADVDLVVVVVVRVAAVEVDRPQVGRGAVVEHRVDVGRAVDAVEVEGLDAGQGDRAADHAEHLVGQEVEDRVPGGGREVDVHDVAAAARLAAEHPHPAGEQAARRD